MMIIKVILLLVLVAPFIFVIGCIASSAETIGPFPVGNYQVQAKNIAVLGRNLQSATEDIVMMEIEIARNIIFYLKNTTQADSYQVLYNIKRLSSSCA